MIRRVLALTLAWLMVAGPALAQVKQIGGFGGSGGGSVDTGDATNITGVVVGDGATLSGESPLTVANGGTATTSVTNNRLLRMSATGGNATVTASILSDNALNATLATGAWLVPDGTVAAPAYSFTNAPNGGWWYDASNTAFKFSAGGVTQITVSTSTVTAANGVVAPFFQTTTASPAATGVVRLAATDYIKWLNGATTFTLGFDINNVITISDGTIDAWASPYAAGGGALYGTRTNHPAFIFTNSTQRWRWDTSGHYLANSDNSVDIGAANATRPRRGYFAAGIVLATAPATNLQSSVFSYGVDFAGLGTPDNGTSVYCRDCTKATPCAAGGTGSLAKRMGGAWDCD